jgi:uncharacterized protein YjdB
MTIIRINANSESIIDRLKQSAITMEFNVTNENESSTIIRIETDDDVKLDEWVLSESLENNPDIDIIYNRTTISPFKPYFTKNQVHNYLHNLRNPNSNPKLTPNVTPRLTYFNAKQIATIYGFSEPQPNIVNVIGIISFGGGLFGSIDENGILTNSDVQTYWASIGISPDSYPVVKVVLVNNVLNLPVLNDGATIENTIDVQMVGACCASASTIIILYIAPNTDLGFLDVIHLALNNQINVNGALVKPTTISISWGAPEIYYTNALRNSLNTLFQSATIAGINIFVASGDNGASDGIAGTLNVDFPASSPYVIGCGGTNLVCPNLIYDNSTVETTWSGSGGGFSRIFSIPTYQSSLNLNRNFRAVPDIAGVADPNTGVVFRIGGASYIIGGTSIVAPAYAGFIASLNLNYFILPNIYTYTTLSFHDVINGNNGGFSAKVGYDNNTGLGSLNGSVIGPLLIAYTVEPPVDPVIVTGITLNITTLTLNLNQTSLIIPMISPPDASNTNIVWLSSDTNVATISDTGLIRAIGNGTANIIATTVDQSKLASVALTVITPVSSISLNVPTLLLNPNQTSQLVPTILPITASNKNVNWLSSNTNVATVSNTGLIRALRTGNTTIRSTTVNQSKIASVSVTVNSPVTGITLNVSTIRIRINTNGRITPTIIPPTASNTSIVWSSSNTRICTVNALGVIRGIVRGSAIITARTVDGGKTATVNVTIF